MHFLFYYYVLSHSDCQTLSVAYSICPDPVFLQIFATCKVFSLHHRYLNGIIFHIFIFRNTFVTFKVKTMRMKRGENYMFRSVVGIVSLAMAPVIALSTTTKRGGEYFYRVYYYCVYFCELERSTNKRSRYLLWASVAWTSICNYFYDYCRQVSTMEETMARAPAARMPGAKVLFYKLLLGWWFFNVW